MLSRPTSDGRDPEFGRKLDALAQAIGHLHESDKFENASIAEALKVDKARITDMRKGKVRVRDHHIPRLIAHFNVTLDPAAFRWPLGRFEKHLRDIGLGIHGGAGYALALQALRSMATSKGCLIEICKNSCRAGGFGAKPQKRHQTPRFQEGDRARFKVTVPGPGHLVILDEQVSVETACLMPSAFAPRTHVKGHQIVVPTTSDEDTRYYHVSAPAGLHRLFAIWTKAPRTLPWFGKGHRQYRDDPADLDPFVIWNDHMVAFVDDLKIVSKSAPDDLAVGTADYRIG